MEKTSSITLSRIIKIPKLPLSPFLNCYSKRLDVIKDLCFLSKNNYSWLRSVLVHGSYATGNVTPFSDIDVLMILNKKVVEFSTTELSQYRKIKKSLESYIHHRDPLMHHGVDVIDPKDMENYDESVLPLDTLAKSVLLAGKDELSVYVSPSLGQINAKIKLYKFCQSVLVCNPRLINRSPYKVKSLMSVFFLVPVLLLQAESGRFLYKSDAIVLARERYARLLPFEDFDYVSTLRDEWVVSAYSRLLRAWLSPLERLPINELVFQRISGLVPLFSVTEYEKLLERCQHFVKMVLVHVADND